MDWLSVAGEVLDFLHQLTADAKAPVEYDTQQTKLAAFLEMRLG